MLNCGEAYYEYCIYIDIDIEKGQLWFYGTKHVLFKWVHNFLNKTSD